MEIKNEENKTLSIIEKMKAKTQHSHTYDFTPTNAAMSISTCPNCGAGRAKDDGLTKCGYCGFEFLSVTLTDGINMKKEDNSR